MTHEEATHSKHLIFIRGLLIGLGFHVALRAVEIARMYHNGTRKDGKTPEFQHQVEIMQMALPYRQYLGEHAEDLMICIAFHDTPEDFGRSAENRILEECGRRAADLAMGMDKTGLTTEEYYDFVGNDLVLSLAKGFDRLHNCRTMQCFTPEKLGKYINETREYVLPMLKRARRKFTHLSDVYVRISQEIEVHLRWAEMVRDLKEEA